MGYKRPFLEPNRRDFAFSLLAAVALVENARAQGVCDVTRTMQGSFRTKSYSCYVDARRRVEVTFMRLSDLMFFVAGSGVLPGWLPPSIERTGHIANDVLELLQELFDEFSYEFDALKLRYTFDGRDGQVLDEYMGEGVSLRGAGLSYRTLGVWGAEFFPYTFPLTEELTKLGPPVPWRTEQRGRFLRFATENDFRDLDARLERYADQVASYFAEVDDPVGMARTFGTDEVAHLSLMKHIGAGSLAGFLPVFSVNRDGECGEFPGYGIVYDPPALFVDVAVFENSGIQPVRIDSIHGTSDRAMRLRPYSSTQAVGSEPIQHSAFELRPGERAIFVQRLLFRTVGQLPAVEAVPAVYGPTELPTGIVVEDRLIPFDGRSHNALILSSNVPGLSCPVLEYWCRERSSWIGVGTILTEAEGKERESTQCIEFQGFRDCFRILEKEHEKTRITNVALVITLKDGSGQTLPPLVDGRVITNPWPITLHCLKFVCLSFRLPAERSVEDIATCRLVVRGFYEKYSNLIMSS